MVQKILIAHTDPAAASSLLAALQQPGRDIIVASDALQTMSYTMKERPAAVVLSSQLPGGGGLFVLKRMRISVHTAAIPVIALVGRGGSTAPEFLMAGASECLTEPTDGVAVGAAIARHLAQPPIIREAPAAPLRAPERVAALRRTGLLDSPADETFDALTKLASNLLRAPVTLVSLVDQNRQFFKSQVGLPEPWASSRQTPLSHSFCQWVVTGQDELVVSDARKHAGLLPNLAIRDLGVVAYAGIPLAASGGQFIGSFCAIDSKPHSWSEDDLVTLRDLARLAEAFSALEESNGVGSGTDSVGHSRALTTIGAAITSATRLLQRCGDRMSKEEYESLVRAVERFSEELTGVPQAAA